MLPAVFLFGLVDNHKRALGHLLALLDLDLAVVQVFRQFRVVVDEHGAAELIAKRKAAPKRIQQQFDDD